MQECKVLSAVVASKQSVFKTKDKKAEDDDYVERRLLAILANDRETEIKDRHESNSSSNYIDEHLSQLIDPNLEDLEHDSAF